MPPTKRSNKNVSHVYLVAYITFLKFQLDQPLLLKDCFLGVMLLSSDIENISLNPVTLKLVFD